MIGLDETGALNVHKLLIPAATTRGAAGRYLTGHCKGLVLFKTLARCESFAWGQNHVPLQERSAATSFVCRFEGPTYQARDSNATLAKV